MSKEKKYVRCGMCGRFLEKSTRNIIIKETEEMLNNSGVELVYCEQCSYELNQKEYEKEMQRQDDERRWREEFPNYY